MRNTCVKAHKYQERAIKRKYLQSALSRLSGYEYGTTRDITSTYEYIHLRFYMLE